MRAPLVIGDNTVKLPFCFASAGITLLFGLAFGQTFDVHGKEKTTAPTSETAASEPQKLGWGSNIEVIREARAAEDDLKRGEYARATAHAQLAARLAPQNADLWFLLGYAARMSRQYPLAVDSFQRGLQLHPNSVQGMNGLAQTYVSMGRTEEARRLLLKTLDLSPSDANSLNLAGELFLNSDLKRATEILLRADHVQPSAHTEILLARAYQAQGRAEESAQYLTSARKRAPRNPEVVRAVAGLLRDNHDYAQAISALQSLPNATPDVLAELAYTYELAGDREKAVQYYLQAARQAGDNLELQLSAAQALVNVQKADAARAFLDKARAKNSNYYRLHAILGQIEKQEGNIKGAIDEYQIALHNLPRGAPEGPLYSIQLLLELHELYDRSGDQANAKAQLDAAAREIETAQTAQAPRPEFLRLRAAIETASGDVAAAERDLKEALTLASSNVNILLGYAEVLWRLKQPKAAREMYERALQVDPDNAATLMALGSLAREIGNHEDAEKYFLRAMKTHPQDYRPYLGLGDLYAGQNKFTSAQETYEAANQRMANHPLIVSGGANAALEAHNLELAEHWLNRASGPTNDNPQVMRERERYLTLKGSFQESAKLGLKVLKQLPRDPEAPVYLAYDLYYLGRYQEAFDLSARYEPLLANNKDFALIQGYVHVRLGSFQEAFDDFSRALKQDPKMATGYVNRGYVLNDLRDPEKAVGDFQAAIRLRPEYGEAHLGLAYSYLQQHRAKLAMEQLDVSEKILGKSRVSHLGRAEAYRQEREFSKAEPEYRAALKEEPNDLPTQLALAETLQRLRRYLEAIDTLNVALNLSPRDPYVYAQMAEAFAKLQRRNDALRCIQSAEQFGSGQTAVLMSTGNALLAMGDENAAMQRFTKALDATDANRVSTRLAIAETFIRKGHWDDARRQIGLAFAEARVDTEHPATTDDLVHAGNILLGMHDFDLAETYFQRAGLAGANQRDVVLGLTNAYLARGETQKAQAELASLGDPADLKDDYEYTVARANLYRENQDTTRALAAIARARALAGPDYDPSLQVAEYQLADQEGRQINQKWSLSSRAAFDPVLEDINIYTMDAKLQANPAQLLPPRHSFEDAGEAHYRWQGQDLPPITGFVGEVSTRGSVSLPTGSIIQKRDTFDTIFNTGIQPTVHIGSNTLLFNTGLQFTLQRDSLSPAAFNQDLFRQFLYMSTSSFFNWVSLQGSAIRETGPFDLQNLHSRDASATLEFKVGRPWANTALLTGYEVRDLLYRPLIREYFTTSTYVGLERKFGSGLSVAILGAYLRSWRVESTRFAIAQALRPRARISYDTGRRWSMEGEAVLSRGEGFHAYDNIDAKFLVSYMRPMPRRFNDNEGGVTVAYPLRFSFGVQQETFYDFPGRGRSTVLPVVYVTLF